MKKISIIILMILQLSLLKSESVHYDLMTEVKVQRMGEYLVRYYKTLKGKNLGYIDSIAFIKNKEGKIISPTDWKIYKTMPIIQISGTYFNDFTSAEIIKLKFKDNSIHILISTTPLELCEEEIRKCIIDVNNGAFSEMKCDEPKPISKLSREYMAL